MQRIRDSIKNECFPEFVKSFVRNYYSNPKNVMQIKEKDTADELQNPKNEYNIPGWVINALNAVNVNVLE